MSSDAIRAEGLGKKYNLGSGDRYGTLRDSLGNLAASTIGRLTRKRSQQLDRNEIWALQDVSFRLTEGESMGLIGRNGAGKSTLLKILARVTEPSAGQAVIRGRVGSLLEVGTGFHPELTGRDNIYLNGAVLGMRRSEIRHRFGEIVGFAGVERFIDTPVKRYSSGMYLRLAFAVAAHLETEVLLVDEVLAVGDAAFQLQCLAKMQDVTRQGRSVVFVSHNMENISRLCTRAVLIDQGSVAYIGTTQQTVERYLGAVREELAMGEVAVDLVGHRGRTKPDLGPVQLTRLSVRDHAGRTTRMVTGGLEVGFVVDFDLAEGALAQSVTFVLIVSNLYNQRLIALRSHDTFDQTIQVRGPGRVTCTVPRLPLVPGQYRLNITVLTEAGVSDGVYDALIFEVLGSEFYQTGGAPPRAWGEVLIDHRWQQDSPGG